MLSPFVFSGAQQFSASGRRFVYTDYDADTGADPRLWVIADGRRIKLAMPGDIITVPREVRRWGVEPYASSPTLSGLVEIGDGDVSTGRVHGTVQVLDGELARVWEGWQGLAVVRRYAGAGTFPAVGFAVYNTALAACVRRLLLDTNSTQEVYLWKASLSAEPTYAERRPIRNKLLGVAATSYVVTDGAAYGFTDSTTSGASDPTCDPTKFSNWVLLGCLRVQQTTSRVVIDSAPMLLSAGEALVAVGSVAATGVYMQAELEGVLV